MSAAGTRSSALDVAAGHAATAPVRAVAGKKGASMRRALILCGTAAFVMAFLGGALAFGLMVPARAQHHDVIVAGQDSLPR